MTASAASSPRARCRITGRRGPVSGNQRASTRGTVPPTRSTHREDGRRGAQVGSSRNTVRIAQGTITVTRNTRPTSGNEMIRTATPITASTPRVTAPPTRLATVVAGAVAASTFAQTRGPTIAVATRTQPNPSTAAGAGSPVRNTSRTSAANSGTLNTIDGRGASGSPFGDRRTATTPRPAAAMSVLAPESAGMTHQRAKGRSIARSATSTTATHSSDTAERRDAASMAPTPTRVQIVGAALCCQNVWNCTQSGTAASAHAGPNRPAPERRVMGRRQRVCRQRPWRHRVRSRRRRVPRCRARRPR